MEKFERRKYKRNMKKYIYIISENYTSLGSASPAMGCNILENRPPKDVLNSKTGPPSQGCIILENRSLSSELKNRKK
jgi:hypothetical protein